MTRIDQSDAQGLAKIAVALTEQTEAPIAKTALEMTVRRWAELDRDGALEFAKSHLQATEESPALSAILRIWTSEDSQAAWMYATESGTDSRLKKKMQQTIISQLAITDPLHALHLMSHSELSSVRNDSALIVSIFHQLATEDAESAIIEADQLTTASKRDAYGAILAYLGANAPSRGLELLETLPNTASIAWSYQQSFVSSWVKKDLQAAGRQLIAMEASELQNQLIGVFMSRAAYRDIDATLARDRVAAVAPIQSADLLATPPKRAKAKVPFGSLIERGMIQPGDVLFDAKRRFTAQVRADGSLVTTAKESGSIHSLGAKLQSQPSCNGWTFWHVSRNGQDVPIDQFRDEIRAADAAGGDG